ncbi:MAG: metallophosphoesterase [Rhodocyclaceae bacterium]|nr:metallophosphoesterase [Rhodocyclaceae bacterium]MDZ4216187.1 metallophosphoesterase [Rhodocyclaceae bacterium]
MKYDIIGDIHGHADQLEGLLKVLGYRPRGRTYKAPNGHKAVFVGDLIDRGPAQIRVLDIVRSMIDGGDAVAVMGNHEFNAIGFITRSDNGDYLRPHTRKNLEQHAEFLAQVGEESPCHLEWVAWFKILPLAIDLNGIRVAHAWWCDDSVKEISDSYWDAHRRQMSDDFLYGSHEKGSPLETARKILTCGVEWDLPNGTYIIDKAGHQHGEARMAVWRHDATHLRQVAIVPKGNEDTVPNIAIPPEVRLIEVTGSPVFFGHHWFSGTPRTETKKVACLDWSVAKGGPLVAYRWDGEDELHDENFVMYGGSH